MLGLRNPRKKERKVETEEIFRNRRNVEMVETTQKTKKREIQKVRGSFLFQSRTCGRR